MAKIADREAAGASRDVGADDGRFVADAAIDADRSPIAFFSFFIVISVAVVVSSVTAAAKSAASGEIFTVIGSVFCGASIL